MKSKSYLVVAGLIAVVAAFWVVMRPTGNPGQDARAPGAAGPGAALVEVIVPAELSENARIGQRVFEGKCSSCHGANAAGQEGKAPPLVHKIYEPSHHGDFAFMAAARNGVRAHHWPFGNMPPVEGITDAEVEYVITYVRELQRANGIQ